MLQGDTHAEMIAAVKRQIDRWEQYLAAFEAIRDDTHFETPIDEARAELEAQRAILLHLERTQRDAGRYLVMKLRAESAERQLAELKATINALPPFPETP